mgnify:CR=1 FL=1
MHLKQKIEGYGFNYSNKKFYLTLLGTFLFVVGMAWLYSLPYYCIISLGILSIICCPSIIKAQFIWRYEQQKFEAACIYIEQMLCSFQKNPKILVALKDTASITDGNLNILINRAIDMIEATTSSNIYEEAFNIIEKEYNCTRIKVIHKFFIRMEKNGGSSTKSIKLLLDDFYKWQERVYLFQSDRTKIKRNTFIGIVISVLVTSINLLIKKYCDITVLPIYYIATTLFLAILVLFIMISQSKLNVSWIEPPADDARILRTYTRALQSTNKKPLSEIIFFVIVLIITAALIYAAYATKKSIFYFFAAPIAVFTVYILFSNNINKKNAMKSTVSEIRAGFSDWLRDVALNLQYTTLEKSISESLEFCPVVLRSPVESLLEEIEDNPGSVEPFYNFLSEFNLIDIKSSVKILYSLSEIGGTERDTTLEHLVERNNLMIDKNDRDQRKTSNAAMNYIVLIPLVLATVKLAVDMLLVINTFLSSV